MSLKLMRSSIKVLKLDKELLVYPVVSALSVTLIVISLLHLLFWQGWIGLLFVEIEPGSYTFSTIFFALLVLTLLLTRFVKEFLETAQVASALLRFEGESPSLLDGLRAAVSISGHIFAWTIVSPLLGLFAKASEKFFHSSVFEIAWSASSYLVIPVIIKDRVNPITALKHSSKIINHTWGQAFSTELGFEFLMTFLIFLGVLVLAAIAFIGSIGNFALSVVAIYWCLVLIASASIGGVVKAAVYQYGISGNSPKGFDRPLMEGTFRLNQSIFTGPSI